MAKSVVKPAYIKALSDFQENPPIPVHLATDETDPAGQISQWLANLKLLHNVPFRYLVPDERMLPPETIRFFYVDINWLDALVDGAYSIGRYASGLGTNTLYNKVEGAWSNTLLAGANQAARNRRPGLFKKAVKNDLDVPFEMVTGFLLRSQVVKGWKGIQANAYAKTNYPDMPTGAWDGSALPLLRLEYLSDEVLFGIFEGETYRLDLHEPSEGIHFGFDTTTTANIDNLSKNLRNPVDGSRLTGAAVSPDDIKNNQIFRAYGNSVEQTQGNQGGQVVNLYNLSTLLFHKLAAANADVGYTQPPASILLDDTPTAVAENSALAASDFALQMVEGVGMVSFYNTSAGDPVQCVPA